MGPLEATIHNLTNEITKKQRECAELQYYWLRSQTELVTLNKELEKQSDVTQDMDRQLTVLHQKQLRIQSMFYIPSKYIQLNFFYYFLIVIFSIFFIFFVIFIYLFLLYNLSKNIINIIFLEISEY